jgi:SPX domain protein involved in polyphosphate accumulation
LSWKNEVWNAVIKGVESGMEILLCVMMDLRSDYDNLKNILKGGHGDFDEANEAKFVAQLESELEKVSAFCTMKSAELIRRVEHAEENVASILTQAKPNFARVEDEIDKCTTEVSELSTYIRLNYSAFIKVTFY